MDLLDELQSFPGKKLKTYEKRKEPEEDESLSHQVLIRDDLIAKVRNRLDGERSLPSEQLSNVSLEANYDSSLYQGEDMEDNFGERNFTSAATQLIEENGENQAQTANFIETTVKELKLNAHGKSSVQNLESVPTQILSPTRPTTSYESRTVEDSHQGVNFSAKDTQVDETQRVTIKPSASSFNFKLNGNIEDLSSSLLVNSQKNIEQSSPKQDTSESHISNPHRETRVLSEKSLPEAESFPIRKFTTVDFVRDFDTTSSEHEEELVEDPEKVHETLSDVPAADKDLSHNNNQSTRNDSSNLQAVSKNNTIDLGSSSESEEDNRPPVSKAFLLSIKARRSRKMIPSKNVAEDSTSLNKLYNSLKYKNREQILEYRRELSERKGISLEQIEFEKEQVEKLLEVELERNRRIRLQEKRKEKMEKGAQYTGTDQHSISETSDVPDSEPDFSYSEEEEECSNNLSQTDQDDTKNYDEIEKRGAILLIAREERQGPKEGQLHSTTIGRSLLTEASGDESEGCKKSPWPLHDVSNSTPLSLYKVDSQVGKEGNVETKDEYKDQRPHIDSKNSGFTTNNTRKQIGDITSESSSSEHEMNEEEQEKLNKDLSLQRRTEAKKAQELRRKMKLTGLNKVLEMEAEESEDEWHGIGGVDGENSDEYDSELEEMFDDVTKANFDIDDIRAKLVKENKDYDERMINKILHDVKTGGFRKRGIGALDIELSDEEDAYLRKYRDKRRAQLRERVNENIDEIKANPKTQAFFDSVFDDAERKPVAAPEHDSEHEKKVKISQVFVHESLSFLSSAKEDESVLTQKSKNLKNEHDDDMVSLRNNSILKVSAYMQSQPTDVTDDSHLFDSDLKLSTVVQSFTSNADVNDRFKNGVKTVKVSKNSRMIGSTKAAVTSLGKARKLKAPKPISSHHHKPISRPKLFETRDENFS